MAKAALAATTTDPTPVAPFSIRYLKSPVPQSRRPAGCCARPPSVAGVRRKREQRPLVLVVSRGHGHIKEFLLDVRIEGSRE